MANINTFCILFDSLSFFAFSSTESDGSHVRGPRLLYCDYSEDKVPSRLKLLHEGVLFLLMREKIRSSAALEWGILSTTSATRKSKPKTTCIS